MFHENAWLSLWSRVFPHTFFPFLSHHCCQGLIGCGHFESQASWKVRMSLRGLASDTASPGEVLHQGLQS